jgi:excisionase family DNA binding protein
MKVEEYKSFDDMPMFISIPQAAKVLSVSETFLYGFIRENETFPVVQMGRRKFVPTKDLKEWIEEQIRKRGADV